MATKEDIQDWQRLDVTKEFMQAIQQRIDDLDEDVHISLVGGLLEEAARINAGIAYLVEASELPDTMIAEVEVENET